MSLEIKDDELCNIFFEEFVTSLPTLTLAHSCPVCNIAGGRHQRRETQTSSSSGGKNILSSTCTAFMKLNKLLPTFEKHTDARQFLKTVELVLKTNDGIPQSEWGKVFYIVFKIPLH
jgi:hypothetical protein